MATPGAKENEFRSWVNIQMKARKWFTTNIETSTKAGVPDIYVVPGNLRPFWLELKRGCVEYPLIRKEQRVWGHLHATAGGKSYFVYNNYGTGKIHIYSNPVKDVQVSGRYLQLKDSPIATCNSWDLLDELVRILSV